MNVSAISESSHHDGQLSRQDIGFFTVKGDESWNFSLTSIDLTVRYYFFDRKRFSPYIGIGPSFNIKKLSESGIYELFDKSETEEIKDLGLGFNAILGFQFDIFMSLFIDSRVKARYTDNLKQFDQFAPGNISFPLRYVSKNGIDYSSFNYTFGLGVRL